MTQEDLEAKFQRWVQSYFGLIIKVVRAYAALPPDQDDLLQEVLVNLWSSLPNFRGDSKESTWVYRVALQTAMVWRRSEQRRFKHRANLISHASFAYGQDADRQNNNNSVEKCELIERLYDAIRQLPKLDASIAIMHLDGLSYQEISEVLDISENYVGVKLNRIRKELSEKLKSEP